MVDAPPPHIYARSAVAGRYDSARFRRFPPVKNGRRAAADQNFTASVSDLVSLLPREAS
jgi:hypothetical protein